MEKEMNFELETIIDNGSLLINNYSNALDIATSICNSLNAIVVTNSDELKNAKENRASLNKCIKKIDRVRIDSIEVFTKEFTDKCNSLKNLFDSKQKELGEIIKHYENSLKEVVIERPKTITATLKYTNEKLNEKVIAFCEKNGIELSIK